MRLEKAAALLELARRMAANAEGISLEEIAASSGVDRRTAERMRDAVRLLFPQLEELTDDRTKRFRIPGGLDRFMQEPTPDELAELQVAIRALKMSGGLERAELLTQLWTKIQSALRSATRRRLAVDIEALSQAEGLVMQVGPRPIIEENTLTNIRSAIKALRYCDFRYANAKSTRWQHRCVVPYGLLFGRDYYLIGPEAGKKRPVLWRLDRITKLVVGGASPGAPPDFALDSYASRSFGTFQEPPEDIALRFVPKSADDASRYLFHPTQTTETLNDGSLVVRFRAGGLLELAWHLFSWGDGVEILDPPALKTLMIDRLSQALAYHRATAESSEHALAVA